MEPLGLVGKGITMWKARRVAAILGLGLWASAVAIAGPTGSVVPKVFGTQDYTITVLSGTQFIGAWEGGRYSCSDIDLATLSLIVQDCFDFGVDRYYTSLTLPAGAVIDRIGVNTSTTVDGTLSFGLLRRSQEGPSVLAELSIPAHEGFATDYTAGNLGILIEENAGNAYVLRLEHPAVGPEPQYFGFVEIWWRRTVSDPPATATFGDVPASHSFYRFIEALAASGVTGGCGSGNYCPDKPLTRGQMAVFLSKALGLHWSY
jgi:S-layer homology domain